MTVGQKIGALLQAYNSMRYRTYRSDVEREQVMSSLMEATLADLMHVLAAHGESADAEKAAREQKAAQGQGGIAYRDNDQFDARSKPTRR